MGKFWISSTGIDKNPHTVENHLSVKEMLLKSKADGVSDNYIGFSLLLGT